MAHSAFVERPENLEKFLAEIAAIIRGLDQI
jgi:hypothetical protein